MAAADEMSDRSGLAAEYALGTASLAERAEAERLLAADAAFVEEVAGWQRRLEILDAAASPVEPSAALLERIMARIDGEAPRAMPGGAEIIRLQRSRNRWRAAAWLSGAVAAGLAALVVTGTVSRQPQPGTQGSFVAVLQADGKSPAFLAAVDLKSGTIAVRRIGAEALANKSYELWAVGGGRAAPQSLGVIDTGAEIPVDRLGSLDRSGLSNTVLAISEEPIGGSPTGAPTGPVVFTGKLLSIAPKP